MAQAVASNSGQVAEVGVLSTYEDRVKEFYSFGENLDGIKNFGDKFIVILDKVGTEKPVKLLKDAVDYGNSMQSPLFFSVVENVIIRNSGYIAKIISLMEISFAFHSEAKNAQLNKQLQKDAFELFCIMLLYVPAKVAERYALKNKSVIANILKQNVPRPHSAGALCSTLSELVLLNKDSAEFYITTICNFFKTQLVNIKNIDFQPPGFTKTMLASSYKVIQSHLEAGVKNNTISSDIVSKMERVVDDKNNTGNIFFAFIAINPTCAAGVLNNEGFSAKLIPLLFRQLKTREMLIAQYLMQPLLSDENAETIQKLTGFSYEQAIAEIVKAQGALAKNESAIISMESGGVVDFESSYISSISDGIRNMRQNTHRALNNMHYILVEKSVSITIIAISNPPLFKKILAAVNKSTGRQIKTGGAMSFAEKLKNKDMNNEAIIKIQDYYAAKDVVAEKCATNHIIFLHSLEQILKSGDEEVTSEMLSAARKIAVKNGYITTLDGFTKSVTSIVNLIKKNIYNDTSEEDEDDSDDDAESNDETTETT